MVSGSTLGKPLRVEYTQILCALCFSFVRSVTMDKWKDSELERMKVCITYLFVNFFIVDFMEIGWW